MPTFLSSQTFLWLSQLLIASVWIFHGAYSKILRRIPRHEAIVARVLGARMAPMATRLIGVGEVLLGLWVLSGWGKIPCAGVQTAALLSMNLLEILRAKDLLISATGMLWLNAGLLALVWNWVWGDVTG